MSTVSQRLEQAATDAEQAASKHKAVLDGDDHAVIQVEGGTIPSTRNVQRQMWAKIDPTITDIKSANAFAKTQSDKAERQAGIAQSAATQSVTAQKASESAQAKSEAAKQAALVAQGKAETAEKGAKAAQGKAETAQASAEAAENKTGAMIVGVAADLIRTQEIISKFHAFN